MAGFRHVGRGLDLHQPGGNGVDGDAVAAQFAGQAAGHGDQRALAGDIGQQVGRAPQRGVRGQVDDRSAAAAAQRRQGGSGHQPGTAHVHLHHLVPGFDVQFFAALAAGVGDRGVVDQAIQAAQAFDGAFDAAADRGRVGQVEADSADIKALCTQFASGLLYSAGEDVGDHDAGTGLGDGLGEGEAQAAGATGDQHAAAGEEVVVGHHEVLSMALGR